MNQLDNGVMNVARVEEEKRFAAVGLQVGEVPALIPRGTKLRRIGHSAIKRLPVPEADNYQSPWWVLESDFRKILCTGMRDPAWAARIALAIASGWGGNCRLQVEATLDTPLYAWAGAGRAFPAGAAKESVDAADPRAYWFPDPTITQMFIPGMRYLPRSAARAIWATSFREQRTFPLLIAGSQLAWDGSAFLPRSARAHDHFSPNRKR